MKFYVYTHSDSAGIPFYVGKGSGNRAWRFDGRSDFHHRIVAKLGGRDCVTIKVYEVLDERHAFAIERQLISLFRKAGYRLCNFTNGGEGVSGHVHSSDVRRKISERTKGYAKTPEHLAKLGAARKGVALSKICLDAAIETRRRNGTSEETRRKLSIAGKGRVVTEEHRARLSAAAKGRKKSEEHVQSMREANLGKKASEETKAKMRASQLARRLKEQEENQNA